MNIVIVGAGEVGTHLADILSREKHSVSVIDPDPSKARRLMESLDVQALVGDGTRADILTQAGASKADLVVAVSDDDRVNMLACVFAKQMGAKRLILRLKDTGMLAGYRYFYKQTLGFDVVLSTEELAAEEILGTVREHHALEVETFADGRVQLRRLRLREESELTSEPIARLRLPAGVLIVAVARKESFVLPDGDHQLQVGDQIYLIGQAGDLDAFERMAGERTALRRSVVIMGAGGIGREVTRKLRGTSGISIRVIERDANRARAFASENTSDVLTIVGDATDIDLLLEERIGEANIFIATSGDDEQNMVACQLARSLGVERTVAMVNKSGYRQIYDLLGIDQAIAPRVLCSNSILRFVHSGSVAAISVIGDGRAEVLELHVGFKEGKEIKVKNLGLPRGAVLGAIVRKEQVIIPNGDTPVAAGDQVIVFTLPENLEQVEHIFKGK
ncbi:MAG: Trk system potassium transporter TrkA [Planctomycetota bacterium]|nr:MAG: Trk system potassium transporter TrkA [Planctomycetota bacterium]